MRHNEEILELFSQSQFEMKEIVLQKLIHFKTALVNRYLEVGKITTYISSNHKKMICSC